MSWSVADAKNRLSEVLTLADGQAQVIVRRERDYVVLAGDEYRRLRGVPPKFTDFLIHEGPRFDGLEPMKRKAVSMRDPGL